MKLGILTSRSLVDVAAPDRLLTTDELIAASGCRPPVVQATITQKISALVRDRPQVEPPRRELPSTTIETTASELLAQIRDAEVVGR